MTADDIRKHIVLVPFQQFSLNVADGRQILVMGRDFILVSPIDRIVTVHQPDGTYDILDTRLITGVTMIPLPQVQAGPPETNGANP